MQYLSPKLLEAFEFAAVAHQDQFRKNPRHIPYFSHPAAVGLILSKAGFGEEVVIAGLLHDVIEDTSFTAEDIEQKFGKRVLELVLGVTENMKLDWAERNAFYNEHLRTVDEETLAISAADFLANRQSLLLDFRQGKNPWVNFSKTPQEYCQRRLKVDQDRLHILQERLHHSLVQELTALNEETVELTNHLQWD